MSDNDNFDPDDFRKRNAPVEEDAASRAAAERAQASPIKPEDMAGELWDDIAPSGPGEVDRDKIIQIICQYFREAQNAAYEDALKVCADFEQAASTQFGGDDRRARAARMIAEAIRARKGGGNE